MKRIGYWSESPPPTRIRSARDAPTFELWLQFVFLPNARKAAAKGRYPRRSQVGQMAKRQYDYHEFVEEAQGLLDLLFRFDNLIDDR